MASRSSVRLNFLQCVQELQFWQMRQGNFPVQVCAAGDVDVISKIPQAIAASAD